MKRGRAARRRKRRAVLIGFLFLPVLLSVGVVFLLRWQNPPASAFMLRDWFAGNRYEYQWTDWHNLSPQLAIAAVASEDQRFPVHGGFDLGAIREAIRESADGGRMRGASTISQQVAKNLFLWSGRSFVRKGFEAYFTLLIEALWPKRRILEIYLNVAQFGQGVYGVSAASRRYFGITAAGVNLHQAALMMAVLPNPTTMKLDAPSAYMTERAAWIRRQARQLGGAAYLESLR